MKRILLLFLVAAATASRAWNVSVGTWVCNPEASVAVPIEIDDAAELTANKSMYDRLMAGEVEEQ